MTPIPWLSIILGLSVSGFIFGLIELIVWWDRRKGRALIALWDRERRIGKMK